MSFTTALFGMVALAIVIPAFGQEKISIVPKPQEITPSDETFELTSKTQIVIGDEMLRPIAEYLAAHLKAATGFTLHVDTGDAKAGDIRLTNQYADKTHGDEAYALVCGKAGVVISAPKP